MTVKRYRNWCAYTHFHELEEDEIGAFVTFEDYKALLSALEAAQANAITAEWQDEIRNKFIDAGVSSDEIDGGASDGGPHEFTLSEIGQGIRYFKEALEAAQREAEGLRKIEESARKWHNTMKLYRETIELLKKSNSPAALYLDTDRLWDAAHEAQEELFQALARTEKEGG